MYKYICINVDKFILIKKDLSFFIQGKSEQKIPETGGLFGDGDHGGRRRGSSKGSSLC